MQPPVPFDPEAIATDLLDELALLKQPVTNRLIEAIAAALRRAVADDRRRPLTIRTGRGTPRYHDEVASGIRLWHHTGGELVVLEIEPQGDEDLGD